MQIQTKIKWLAVCVTLIIFSTVSLAKESEKQVEIHFFHLETCPHCIDEKPFLKNLEKEYHWLKVNYIEVSESDENRKLFQEMSEECGSEARGVPVTFVCGEMISGYDSDWITGAKIKKKILECKNKTDGEVCMVSDDSEAFVEIPFYGIVDVSGWGLPLLTIVLGGLDGFNPCAFFVLLFLLSMLIHAKDRKRMLLIGGIFVFFSGLIYFLFMAAWLNLFLYIKEVKIITAAAGVIALIVGAINVKDFFYFKKGVSLSISENGVSKLFQRMRNLMKATELSSMIFGTIVLAIAANTYELLCTAGFPMVYTRMLTLNNLTQTQYYSYLALYNLVYIMPLLTIVLIFTYRLGSRKLKEEEGQSLKLLSGNMMLTLGFVLVWDPSMLSNIFTAVSMIIFSLGITAILLLKKTN